MNTGGLQHRGGAVKGFAPGAKTVDQQRLHYLAPNLHAGIQRRHRILKNHTDPLAAHRAQRRRTGAEQVHAPEYGGSRLNAGGGHGQQAQGRVKRNRLPAPGLADDAQRLPPFNGKAHTVHGTRDTVTGVKPDA
ncbi:MAG: hypothetical protein BWX80_03774 [Candidatus Hydrogenedentes bacterium ADurb.Bin101]|nr:MAG: hypothetical protein BWX80_03774 [Candidatus Hydrogenedentes bacterium ADurb.Bin101]